MNFVGSSFFGKSKKLLSHPEIDVICVCNESGSHGATIAKIAKAGKHILCEKPQTTVEKIDRIAEVVKSTGIQLVCIFQNRENPNTKSLKLLSNWAVWVRSCYVKQDQTGIVPQLIMKVHGGAQRLWMEVQL